MVVGNIGGIPGPKGPDGPQKQGNLKGAIEAAADAAKEAAEVIDSEASFMGDKAKPVAAQSSAASTTATTKQQPKADTHIPDDAEAAAAAASSSTDEVEKKKRKKKLTAFEEKMAEMEALEGLIDESQVEEEEKGVVKEFLDNMSKLRFLRRKLRQLEDEKDHLKQLLSGQQDPQKPNQ